MRHSAIQLGKNTVTKIAAPALMRVEVEKNRRAFEIGRDCGLFRVPDICDYDEARGVVVFERIHQIRAVRNVMNGPGTHKSLIERIGRSLAVIHQNLALPDDMTVGLPPEFNLPGTEVFLHGDFNGCNVCCETFSQSIVILDWQMTGCHGGQATYGSKYFDLLWFINYMLWTPTLHYLVCDPVTPAAKLFLDSYFEEANIRCDANMLMLYAKAFFDTRIPLNRRHASRRTGCLLWRSQILTKRFVKSIKTMEPEADVVC